MIKKTVTTAVVLALGASLAMAGPGEGKFGKRHGRHGEAKFARLAEKLNLTDAQKQQIQEQQRNFMESNRSRFETHRDTMRQYREARQAGDTARADALKATLELQRGEIKQLRQAQHEAMLSVLTAEQRTRLEALKAERGTRRGQNRNQQ